MECEGLELWIEGLCERWVEEEEVECVRVVGGGEEGCGEMSGGGVGGWGCG